MNIRKLALPLEITSPYPAVAILFILNLAMRFALGWRFASTPYFEFILNVSGPDPNYFLRWAEAIHEGHWTWQKLGPNKAFYIAPFYSTLEAMAMHFSKDPTIPMLFLQALCSSVLVFAFFDLGKRIQSPFAGLVAAFIWTLYAPSYFYDACLIRSSLVTSFTFLTVWFFVSAADKGQPWRWLLCGVALGVLSNLRPHIFIILLPVMAIVHMVSKPDRHRMVSVGLLAITLMLSLAPTTLYNFNQTGRLIPVSSQGADALILGNDPFGPGVSYVPTENSKQMKKKSQDKTAQAIQIIFEEIKTKPENFFNLYKRKIRMLFNDYEIPANYSFYIFKRLLPETRVLSISFQALFPFFVIGCLGLPFRSRLIRRFVFLFVLLLGSILLIHIQSRYRMPLIPFMIFMAALGWVRIWNGVLKKSWPKLLGVFVVLTSLYIWSQPLPSYGYHHIQSASKERRLNTNPIRVPDYITLIMSWMITDKEGHKNQIDAWSVEAHDHYGEEFMRQFSASALSLTQDVDTTFRPAYIKKYNLLS